jgi:hypothetical protein
MNQPFFSELKPKIEKMYRITPFGGIFKEN